VLRLEGGAPGPEITEGNLECPSCSTRYPVLDGIPRFVPPRNYADSFGFQWNLFDKTQMEDHWGANISQQRFERETGWPADLKGDLILEAGCGMGRFTAHAAATGAEITCIDYSSAIDAANRNNARFPNVHFVQGDIYHLPFKLGLFDRLYCFGVLQHCPDPKRAFLSLVPFVRSGGHIVADVYRFFWLTLLNGYYYIRPFTKGRDPAALFRWVRTYFDLVYTFTGFLRGIHARTSSRISFLLGIADYRGVFDIAPDRMRELCLLDTFDRLSPAHDHPQTVAAVKKWLQEAGLKEIAVHPGYNGIEAHGRKA